MSSASPAPASPPAPPGPAASPTPPPQPPSGLSTLTKVGLLSVPIVVIPVIEVGAMIAAGWMGPAIGLAILALIGVLASAICMAVAFNVPIDRWKNRSVALVIWVFIAMQVAVALAIVFSMIAPHVPSTGGSVGGTFQKVWDAILGRAGQVEYLGARLDASSTLNKFVYLGLVIPVVMAAAAGILYAAMQFGLGWGVKEPKENAKIGTWLWYWTQRFIVAPSTKIGVSAFALFFLPFWWANVWLAPAIAAVPPPTPPPVVVEEESSSRRRRKSDGSSTTESTKSAKRDCDPEMVAFLRGLEAGSGSDQYSRAGLKDCPK